MYAVVEAPLAKGSLQPVEYSRLSFPLERVPETDLHNRGRFAIKDFPPCPDREMRVPSSRGIYLAVEDFVPGGSSDFAHSACTSAARITNGSSWRRPDRIV